MSALDIDLIEQEGCPTCLAEPREHCNGRVKRGRVWPWSTGTAGPDWCHPARQERAISNGLLGDERPVPARGRRSA